MPIKPILLYADVNQKECDSFTHFFSSRYQVHTVSSSALCMTLLKKQAFDVLVVDRTILEKAGISLLSDVQRRYPDVSLVLTGMRGSDTLMSDAMNTGHMLCFIQKPWNNAHFDVIGRAAGRRKIATGEKRKVQELQSMVGELNFLHTISQQISAKKPLPALLNEIMEGSKLLMHAEASSLLLYDPKEKKLDFFVATGTKGKLLKKYSLPLGQGIGGWVGKHRQSLLIQDCYTDPRFCKTYDDETGFRTRSMICVPLIRKKRLLGVMQVINKKGGGEFENRDLKLFETLASYCAIAIENHKLTESQVAAEALERELETARAIQQRSLPASLPEYADIDVAAQLIPAKQVGGDYYNVIKIDEQRTLLVIADVAGKGVPGALIVSTLWTYLTSYFKLTPEEFDLNRMIKGLNGVLIEATTSDRFVTAWFGLYHHPTRKLMSLNAGHNPPCLFRASQPQPVELQAGGIFLGGFDLPYQTEEIELQKGDCLVFYTDGVTEAFNAREEEYEMERLLRIIQEHQGLSAHELLEKIQTDVKKHVGKAPQSDDITCAVMKVL